MARIDEKKRAVVAEIIRKLHEGLPIEDARDRVLREVGKLSSAEITDIEQSLIDEGVSPDEIRRFCNVHALLFDQALEKAVAAPGGTSHPLTLLAEENRRIEGLVAGLKAARAAGAAPEVKAAVQRLAGVDRHYAIKEHALFPALERHGFPGPSKVMWAKHDEVRAMLKKALAGPVPAAADLDALVAEIEGMIYKEENILFPAAQERIAAREWVEILSACDEIGFPYIKGAGLHATILESEMKDAASPALAEGEVALPSGRVSLAQLRAMLDVLPVDISFVDADDKVAYFNETKERLFVRARTVIGRDVHNCHPPQSVHKVKAILDDFRSGKRDHADFWISMKGRFIYIRYFAAREKDGTYLGCLEVTQDLTEIMKLSGEKRLLDDAT